jgi:hypothetical protein
MTAIDALVLGVGLYLLFFFAAIAARSADWVLDRLWELGRPEPVDPLDLVPETRP